MLGATGNTGTTGPTGRTGAAGRAGVLGPTATNKFFKPYQFDPHVEGAVWNSGGVLKISGG
jgi:hypothetical protein